MHRRIVTTCLAHYGNAQAIYLFGSHAAGADHAHSDVDVALLLPPATARAAGSLVLGDLHQALERELGLSVDLVNLRRVGTVFAKEIIAGSSRLHCADEAAADEFEALTLSLYQELNVERAAILRDFHETGRAYAV